MRQVQRDVTRATVYVDMSHDSCWLCSHDVTHFISRDAGTVLSLRALLINGTQKHSRKQNESLSVQQAGCLVARRTGCVCKELHCIGLYYVISYKILQGGPKLDHF